MNYIMTKLSPFLFGALLVLSSCNQPDSRKVGSEDDQDPNPSMNNPDKQAWQLFVEVNKPADSNRPGRSAVWETWALAKDVYNDPNKKPIWDSVTNVSKTPRDFDRLPLQQLMRLDEGLESESDSLARSRPKAGLDVFFIPTDLLADSTTDETRMNKVVFDYVANNDLYYVEGQEAFFNQSKVVDLPIQAKEVKAQWRRIGVADTGIYHYNSISVYDSVSHKTEVQYWGLVSMHIISKDIPQWTWATFEHERNPGLPKAESDPNSYLHSRDSFGRKDGRISQELSKLLADRHMPGKWSHYLLRGTQTGYITFEGRHTLLANTYIEEGFTTTSSCITCHSKATIGRKLDFQELPQPVQNAIRIGTSKRAPNFANRLSIFKVTNSDTTIADNGIPSLEWYFDDKGIRRYIQTDFMWSFFRAKRRMPYTVPNI
ncbi:MAG: hypothetical protein ABI876_00600 [Bacteroidota bacterium]